MFKMVTHTYVYQIELGLNTILKQHQNVAAIM